MIERIVPIVEGEGEVLAVPVLLRRLLSELGFYNVSIELPFRGSRSSLVSPNGIETAIARASRYAKPSDAILVLLDGDDDKTCILGPELHRRAKLAQPDRPLMVALAEIEFETWFLASAESLAGARGLGPSISQPTNFEAIRDAKGWLSSQKLGSSIYAPARDQAALTARMDLDLARQHSRSFRRFCERFRQLLSA